MVARSGMATAAGRIGSGTSSVRHAGSDFQAGLLHRQRNEPMPNVIPTDGREQEGGSPIRPARAAQELRANLVDAVA